ncbi:thioredoxin domain-containing protein [Oceanobacillus sp. CFH 90083]|uniref:DsbA family protein n=1 Tax=Oceanobacillus sp. CFH 90083 TaxID=2592336 RepID=UPI00128C5B50|nr:thioredoxin domain-containing protein [Oceanobacillus sp. CFH 90083]
MKKSPMKLIVAITLIVIALLVLIVVLVNQNSGSFGQVFDDAPSIEGQPTLGDPDAPVTIVEFGDYKCPGCKAWNEAFVPQLEADYVESGQVQIAYVNTMFQGEESRLASLAAEIVYEQNPDVYWDFHNALFAAQPEGQGVWVTEDRIEEIANSVDGVDTEALMEDIENNTKIDELERDSEMVSDYNVNSTPSIMVNNIMIDGEETFNYEFIQEAIESELGE